MDRATAFQTFAEAIAENHRNDSRSASQQHLFFTQSSVCVVCLHVSVVVDVRRVEVQSLSVLNADLSLGIVCVCEVVSSGVSVVLNFKNQRCYAHKMNWNGLKEIISATKSRKLEWYNRDNIYVFSTLQPWTMVKKTDIRIVLLIRSVPLN